MKLLFALAYALNVLHLFNTFAPDEAAVRAVVLAVAYVLAYAVARLVHNCITRIVRRN